MEELPAELQSALNDLERDYERFELHPIGANGYLVFARNRISQMEVAIKFYYGAPGEHRHDEPRLLAAIQSPNVLPLIDARNLAGGWALFVTRRCREGDLDDVIASRPSVHRALDIALGICSGVSAIHAKGLIHRDLKPGNVVSERGTPLIADFGSVRQIVDGMQDVPASGHSVLYRPPESFATRRYSALGDVYQIGLVTYQLLGGNLPYEGTEYFNQNDRREYATITDGFDRSSFVDQVIQRRAARGTLMDFSTLPPWVGGSARTALRRMTNPDPDSRLRNTADIAAALTRLRANMKDWKSSGDVVCLDLGDRKIELRPVDNALYEAVQSKGAAFRRVPGAPAAPLSDLVARFN